MNKYIPSYIKLLIFSLLFFFSNSTFASHIVGLDLSYSWVSGNTYKITLVAYGDCGSAALTDAFSSLPSASPAICIFDGNTQVTTIALAIQPPTAGVEITPVCPADINNTQCTNTAFSIPGIKKFVYSANYTVPHTSAVWRFMFFGYMGGGMVAGAGRAAAITNIVSGTVSELVDTLNNTVGHNSNPLLTVVPTPFFCLNNTDNYNPGAVDADGDSLAFFLVPGKGAAGASGTSSCVSSGSVTYISPFTATNPLAATSLSFDQHTGQISFFPNALQRALVVYNIREYRGGVVVGTSQREMTFLVLTCTNTAPSGGLVDASSGTIVDSTHFSVCSNTGPYNINIYPTSSNPVNNITVTYSGLPSGAAFTVTGNGTPSPHCVFSWTTAGVAPGNYTFFVTYTDNNCPLAGTQTLAYTITVLPSPGVTYTLLSAATCIRNATFSVHPSGAGAPFTVLISQGPGDTVQTFNSVFSSFNDSLPSGSYTITIRTPTSGGCSSSIPLLIAFPPAFTTTGTFTSPTFCGLANGTITLHHLPPGYPDSVRYTLNGVLQPVSVHIPLPDSTIVLTGLTAGSYSNLTVTYGNCVSFPIGPFNLVNPPALPAHATIVSPSYCGHNDGSITIKGLIPGYTDTIKYLLNGVAQPSSVHIVASDSSVTLSNLIAGTYSGITATYGPCPTAPLGPFVLVNPPIPTPAATFTNPSYCGHNDGTITISNLHAGDLDTIKYSYNGVLQPPQVLLVSATGTATLTGLLAGVYNNITASFGPCVTTAIGPYTLTNPSIPTASGTFTNPSYCGHLDGTITISNLHPGDADTIRYAYNSVLQPGTVHVVSASGTIILTGLPVGTYSNITAIFGPCVTNAVGPFTLTTPPLPLPTATFIDPTYCGHNDGSITLTNLHPGDVDTISFSLNGIPQTPRSLLVSATGTVVLSALTAGVYSNIVATFGPCATTAIGPLTLSDPPLLVPNGSFTSPTYCAATDGTITINNLHPGDADSVQYSLNGIAQPAVVLTVPPSGSIVLTGLIAGLYANIHITYNGCVTSSIGPYNLVNPPFTLRNVTFTNPTKCGFCDGTISFLGLHPNQVDTIRYNYNGTPQAMVSVAIPTDSTIILPNLCEGIYSNMIVNTTAACVSNIFGPDTLVAPPIIPGFTYNLIKNCVGDTLICTNTSWPAATLTYTWYFGDGTSDTATNPVHVYHTPGVYPIKLVITNTRCYDSTTQTIILDNLINAGFTENPDSFLCVGSPVTFTNSSLGTSLTYLWNFGDGITDTNTNTSHIYTHIGNYQIVLTVTNFVPCIDTALAYVTVDSMSGITLDVSDSVLCKGGAVTFTGNYSLDGNTGILWHFSSGDSIRNVNPVLHSYENTGLFTVQAEAFYRACPDTSVTRTVLVIPYPLIDLGPDTAICPGSGDITLVDNINASNPAATWVWNTGQTSPAITAAEPGSYSVKVSINGCASSDEVEILNNCYLNIPNIFTPNGDGVNDFFLPRSLLARGMSAFHMMIFNRWGQLIFETSAVEGRGWDGKFNDIPQPEGVFIFDIDATFLDGQKEHHQGNLTLLR